VNLLLDTHAFLWFISADARLPGVTRAAIQDPANDVWLSAVSVWEATVKQQIGRLTLPSSAASYLPSQRERHGIDPLALEEAAIAHLAKLPTVHRDPFDRMLICQALEHDLRLVTDDENIRRYPVKIAWNDSW
jgi:PIN domain nuclease of toxin-antitoxin system